MDASNRPSNCLTPLELYCLNFSSPSNAIQLGHALSTGSGSSSVCLDHHQDHSKLPPLPREPTSGTTGNLPPPSPGNQPQEPQETLLGVFGSSSGSFRTSLPSPGNQPQKPQGILLGAFRSSSEPPLPSGGRTSSSPSPGNQPEEPSPTPPSFSPPHHTAEKKSNFLIHTFI